MREAAVVARPDVQVLARAYHELTKPGITLFVGLTALAGYFLSAGSAWNFATAALVMLATMLMSSGAAALNQVAERSSDAMMRRTAIRPLPAGLVSPASASAFGWALTAVGSVVSLATLPFWSFVFLAACHVAYVHIYTPLKKKTVLCTLVGAIPGALPVLAGSAAVGIIPNSAALALTGVLFMWQIPHFFAIGWLVRQDYARAGFRMLPVVDSDGSATARASVLYAIAMHGLAIIVTRELASPAFVMAVVHTIGTWYALVAVRFWLRRDSARARALFFSSLVVLPVVLIALVLGIVFG
jgi:heme o synthase